MQETWVHSIPRLGRSPGGGRGNPTPVFLPGESPWTEEYMWAAVHSVTKSRTRLSGYAHTCVHVHTHTHTLVHWNLLFFISFSFKTTLLKKDIYMFIIADEDMSVQWDEHFQVLHGIQGRVEIKFLICGISKPIISYTHMTATDCGGWDGWCLIQLSWVHWKLIWVPESGLTGGWRVVPSLSCLRSSGMGGGWSPGWLIGLGLRGIQGGWLEQNRSRDCREPISHHFTFHSILVSEGEAFQSWPKVEGPHKFSLVACYFCFAALRWTFCSLCSSGFHLQLTHASRNGCSFQK